MNSNYLLNYCINNLWNINYKGMLSTVPDGVCLSPFSHLCKKRPNWNEVRVLFALSWLPSLVLKLTHLRCQPGVFPLPRCHSDQHTQRVPSGLRAQIWQTTWKEKRQRKHGYFHSFDMLNTQNPLQQRVQFLLCSVFSHTHGEDIEELCSALMHWLWSYAMCLPEQWRETMIHTNNSGAQCHLGDHPYSISSMRTVHFVQ